MHDQGNVVFELCMMMTAYVQIVIPLCRCYLSLPSFIAVRRDIDKTMPQSIGKRLALEVRQAE